MILCETNIRETFCILMVIFFLHMFESCVALTGNTIQDYGMILCVITITREVGYWWIMVKDVDNSHAFENV